jgi:hypothetical protein
MVKMYLLTISVFFVLWLRLTDALVTLTTIRNLTAVTDECRERIESKTAWQNGKALGLEHAEDGQSQITLGDENDASSGRWTDEVEDVSLLSSIL